MTTSGDADAPERVELSGEYDLLRRDEVRALFDGLTSPYIVLDLCNVTYVDSSFLSALIGLRNRLPDCSITLYGPNPQVKRIFDIVDFGRIFSIVDR